MSMIYAIGDIHGMLGKLQKLIARCEEHAAGRPMTLAFVGDYIDRGPEAAGVVRCLIDLRDKMPDRVIALMGNHEMMVLAVIDEVMPERSWLLQGGAATLQSYGVSRARELPPEHLDWLNSLQLAYDDGRRLFVHAGINPDKPLDAQTELDLLWIREPFLSDGRDHGRLIVHGHTPVMTGAADLRSNRLNLDTGAVFGGPLTAAVFDDTQTKPITFLQAG